MCLFLSVLELLIVGLLLSFVFLSLLTVVNKHQNHKSQSKTENDGNHGTLMNQISRFGNSIRVINFDGNIVYCRLVQHIRIVNSGIYIILISSKTVFKILRSNTNVKKIICKWWCDWCLIKYNIVLSQEWSTQNNFGAQRISFIHSNCRVAPLIWRCRII